MSSHPSAEAVSDLVEGLLPPEQQRKVQSHLEGCVECRDLRDALSDVRALLGDLPDARMPDDVAGRLDHALADAARAEPPEKADTPPADDRGGPATVAGPVQLAARRRRRAAAVVGAAAASLVLVMAGALLVLRGVQPSGGQGDTAAQAERTAPKAGAAEQAPPQPLAGAAGYVTTSGRDYSRRSLASGVTSLLQSDGFAARGQERPTGSARLADPSALASCLSAIAPGGPRPLAVDLATYAGEPAAVVVLPIRHNSDVASVWVVAPECTTGRPHVLVRQRVPRP